MEELAQQCTGARRVVAGLALQMFSGRVPSGMATTSPHVAHLPTVRETRQHLHVPRTSFQDQRVGSLALLLQPGVSLEWLPRLCCVPEYCPPGRGTDSSCANHWTSGSSFHHPFFCETRLLYGDAGGATVTAADPSGSPDRIRKDLLQWVASVGQTSFVV